MRSCSSLSSCSTSSKSISPSSSPTHQTSITNLYKTRARAHTIQFTWSSQARTGPALSLSIDHLLIPIPNKHGTFTCPLTGPTSSITGVTWDLSAAKYGPSPEPEFGFYVIVVIDKEIVLTIGDKSREFMLGFNADKVYDEVGSWLVSRTVEMVGPVCSAMAQFSEEGKEHEVAVKVEEGEGEMMGVYVDERKVVDVRRLRWNFRGKETVFVDGLGVDVAWDLKRWLFPEEEEEEGGGGGRAAVVVFQTRVGEGRRRRRDEEEEEFTLLLEMRL